VTVLIVGEVVRVEVTDRSGATIPVLRPGDSEAEGSRGLYLVEALAARWGFEQDDVAVAGRDDVAGPGVAVDDARGRGGADRGPFLLKIGEPGREPGPVASGQGG
jgi:hypothetical protein